MSSTDIFAAHRGDTYLCDVPLPGKALLLPRHVEADKQMRLRRLGSKSSQTRRWSKRDSNSRSRPEGNAYGEPFHASIAVSDLNL